jgi:hypothetical protein
MRLATTNLGPIKISDRNDIDQGRTIVFQEVRPGEVGGWVMDVPNPGAPCGLVDIQASHADGVTTVTWTFRTEPQRIAPDKPNRPTREIRTSAAQRPINMHKDFDQMFAKYGRALRFGRVEWLERDPDSGGTSGLSKKTKSTNPMAGVETFLTGSSIFSETTFYRTRKSVPAGVMAHMARTGLPPGSPGGKPDQWLGTGVSISSTGDSYAVTRQWMRDERGWLPDLYPLNT